MAPASDDRCSGAARVDVWVLRVSCVVRAARWGVQLCLGLVWYVFTGRLVSRVFFLFVLFFWGRRPHGQSRRRRSEAQGPLQDIVCFVCFIFSMFVLFALCALFASLASIPELPKVCFVCFVCSMSALFAPFPGYAPCLLCLSCLLLVCFVCFL